MLVLEDEIPRVYLVYDSLRGNAANHHLYLLKDCALCTFDESSIILGIVKVTR